MIRTAVAIAVVACAAVVSGCASIGGTPAEQRAGDSILLAAPERPEAFMDALIAGTLVRTDAGCLAVQGADELTYVLQFPFGSRLAEDGESVEVPGLGVVRLGDAIEGGGGYVDVPSAPEECRISEEFAVWQSVPG